MTTKPEIPTKLEHTFVILALVAVTVFFDLAGLYMLRLDSWLANVAGWSFVFLGFFLLTQIFVVVIKVYYKIKMGDC